MTWFSRWRRNDDLRAEIGSHLDMATRDRIERGASPDEANAAARRELGNISQIQEATRDVWGWRWLERLAQDLRYALRVLRRNPSFATVAILSLALGIGANTALFQVVDAVRLRTLPVADPGTLADVHIVDMEGARGNFETWRPAVTHPIWREIRDRQQAFSGLFAWGTDTFNLSSGGEVRAASGLWVSGDFFNVLGVRPVLGRTLGPEDDRPGCPARTVLSYAFWQRTFGGDPSVVGHTLTLSSRPVEVIGVAPPEFFGLEVGRTFDVAVPVCSDAVFSDDGKGRLELGTNWWLSVFGRLKPGWTLEKAAAHLAAISPALFRSALPPTYPARSVDKYLNFKLSAYPAATGLSSLREEYETPLWLLLGVAALVLVIACANLANLLLARATARSREIAIRLGLGASRARIVRQLLTESLLLALLGTVGGMWIAGLLSRSLVTFLDTRTDSVTLPVGLNWHVFGFAVVLAILTCVLFGLAPALKATRVGAGAAIRATTTRGATADRESVGLRRTLVVAQVALALALLFGSLLFARSLRNVMSVDLGFHSEGIVIAGLNYRRVELPEDRRRAFKQELIDRIRALPGIQSASSVDVVPISGSASGNDVWPETDRSRKFNTSLNWVGNRYFATLGIPIIAGRDFDDHDTAASQRVAIVDEAFAAALPQGVPTVGTRITREVTPTTPEMTFEIVGVVRNSKYRSLKEQASPVAFFADTQSPRAPRFAQLVVRSSLPSVAVTAAVTRTLADIDPRIGVTYTVMTSQIRDTLVRERLLATLSGGFGGLAAALTVVGLYGLIAYTVTRRTTEIGVRMALGATRANIARLMLRETSLLLAAGVVLGVVAALAGGRAAAALLFGVKPYDPLTLAGAVVGLAIVAFAASYLPARRATRIEPVAALRVE
jgi:putative ABC transport system permease protein